MKKGYAFIISFMVLAMALTGCATSVKVSVERPAELDLNGAKTVGILPFQAKQSNSGSFSVVDFFGYYEPRNSEESDRKQLVDYLTRTLQEELANSPYLDLIDSNSVQRAISSGSAIPCDVYLTGAFTRFETSVNDKTKTIKYADGQRNVRYYYRVINAEFIYQVIDAQTSRIVSLKTVPIELTSADQEKLENVDSVYKLAKPKFDTIVQTIVKQLQPHTETKYLVLLSDPNKNPEMKNADEAAKAGNVEYAESLFEDIYVRYGYMEAGYNAAILLEAMGNLEGARDLMQEVYDIFKDQRAAKALKDIDSEIESAKKLEHQNEIRK